MLIVEDVAFHAEVLVQQLRGAALEAQCTRVDTESAYIEALADEPDVILADINLPNFSAARALELLRRQSRDIPFIVVTGTASANDAVRWIRDGADDFVLKDDLGRLNPAIVSAIERQRLRAQRHAAEARILHLNDLLHAVRDVGQLIVRLPHVEQLFREACEILVRTRGYVIAWIADVESGLGSIAPAARAGRGVDFVDELVSEHSHGAEFHFPAAAAIREREPCVWADIQHDPRAEPWRAAALDRGLRSAVAVPLMYRGRVLGSLSVYGDRPNAFDDEEIELLSELAGDISFSVHVREDQQRHRIAEQRYRDSEARFRTLVEHAPETIILLDGVTGELRDVNPNAERLFGLPRQELIGKRPFDLSPPRQPDGRMSEEAAWEKIRAAANGDFPVFEWTHCRLNGEEFPCEVRLVRLPGDEVPLIRGSLTDISERKAAEVRLRTLSRAVEHSPAGVVITDPHGTILYVNPMFTEITRYSSEAVVGRSPRLLKSGFHEDRFYQELWGTINAGKDWRGEFRNRRKDGSLYWESSSISPIRDESGRVTHFVNIKHDVTAQKEMEADLRENARVAALRTVVSTTLSRSADLGDLLQLCMEALIEHIDGTLARVWTLDERQQVLFLRASAGLYTHIDGGHARIPLGEFKVGRIAANRKPLLSNQVVGDPQIHDQEWAEREKLVAFAGYPLIVDGQLIGVVALFARHELSKSVMSALESVSTEIANGIVRKRLEGQRDRLARFPTENPDPVLRVASTGVLDYANPASGVLLQHWNCRVGTALPDVWHQRVLRVLTVAAAERHEDVAQGRTFELLLTPVPQASYVNIYGRDVTDRVQLEQQLRANNDRYCALTGGAYDLIAEIDQNARFVYLSPNFDEVLGWAPAEYIGRDAFERVHPDDLPIVKQAFQDTFETGQVRTVFRLEHANGSWHAFENTAIAYPTATGELCLLAICRDITETRELEKQLRHAQRMESIGRLAGGVAHDFNNLMTGVIGFTQLVLKNPLSEQIQRDLQQVRGLADRATALTRQLLAFSRKQALEPVALSVNELLDGVTRLIERLIGEDIDLLKRFEAAGIVHADPGQLEQILVNLAVNSRDAMPDGGRLTIETRDTTLTQEYAKSHTGVVPGSYVLIAVSDTGHGMDRATQDRIFEPFFTTKDQGKGTGLGLATVYGIVKQHGGNIWVYSEPGHGTTFKIYLPRHQFEEETVDDASDIHAIVAQGEGTILLVEDESTVREVASRNLEAEGYNVLVAANPEQAREHFASHVNEITLLVTDVVMPGESGRTLFESLRLLRPDLPVLYMSGYTENAIVHHGVLEPRVPYLQKPFTADQLLYKVNEVLAGSAYFKRDE